MVPVQTTDYIMDVVSSMERQGFAFSLCFRRVLWLQGLRLDNELLVSVIYYQVKLVRQVLQVYFRKVVTRPLQNQRGFVLDERKIVITPTCDFIIFLQVLPDFMAGYLLATHGRSFGDAQVNSWIIVCLLHCSLSIKLQVSTKRKNNNDRC